MPACCAAAPPTFSAALAAFGLTAMRNVTWSCGFGFTFVSCKYQQTALYVFLNDSCIYKPVSQISEAISVQDILQQPIYPALGIMRTRHVHHTNCDQPIRKKPMGKSVKTLKFNGSRGK